VASYLVVANRTLGGDELVAHLRRVIESDPEASFEVVVPVRMVVPTDTSGVMGGLVTSDAEIQEHLTSDARARLGHLLAWLQDAEVPAHGTLVTGDPVAAMEKAAQRKSFDEIIISTLPARISNWLRMDLAHRAERRFHVPITTIVGGSADQALPMSTDSTTQPERRTAMAESVYKIIELVGTSTDSWEKAASAAVTKASLTLRDLRVAEVAELDLVIEDGSVTVYRAKVKVSFKYESEGEG
jgi:dodecin